MSIVSVHQLRAPMSRTGVLPVVGQSPPPIKRPPSLESALSPASRALRSRETPDRPMAPPLATWDRVVSYFRGDVGACGRERRSTCRRAARRCRTGLDRTPASRARRPRRDLPAAADDGRGRVAGERRASERDGLAGDAAACHTTARRRDARRTASGLTFGAASAQPVGGHALAAEPCRLARLLYRGFASSC